MMVGKPSILCVDDEPINLKVLLGLLSDDYEVKVATNGAMALQVLSKFKPDMILLDIRMPEMDGIEVCRRLRQDPSFDDVPVLFITAETKETTEDIALDAGGNDFVNKPFSPRVLKVRIETYLRLRQENYNLEAIVQKRLSQIHLLQDASMFVMVTLAEFRDECTGNHIRRTQYYVKALAQQVATWDAYREIFDENYITLMTKSAPLHDIGKIAIKDEILLKPGKLTDEEFEEMKSHAQKGYDILKKAEQELDEESGEFLRVAEDIAITHHEKWDGTGYPNQLAGEQIPMVGRIMAIADVYDALTSERPYKKAFSQEKTFEIMLESSGTHFQPELLNEFIALAPQLLEIQKQFAD